MTALLRARMVFGGAEEQTDMKKEQQKSKHTTKPAKDFVDELITTDQQDADEFDALARQDSNRHIDGWFTPSDKRPLPQVVKGTIVDCVARRNPSRSQNPHYFIVELAAPVIGLRMPEEGDSEGYEDTLETGEVIGIDMRQALEKLREHRGKVKLVFLEKVEIDDRQWWKTAVYANLGDGKTNNLDAGKGSSSTDEIPF